MSLTLLFDVTEKFFAEHKIPDDHGYKHAVDVAYLAMIAVQDSNDVARNIEIVAAALLHDADDRKLFKTANFENAKTLLWRAGFKLDQIARIVEMIALVSASTNGNSVVEPAWKLIPRDADRVEALGVVGVKRCYEYTFRQKHPVATAKTAIATNHNELDKIDTRARFAAYVESRGNASRSMIDHFYDKLLAIHVQSGNKDLQKVADERREVMVDWLFTINTVRRDNPDADLNACVEKWITENE